MTATVDDLLWRARLRITRVGPHELEGLVERGAVVVDIRPTEQRESEGSIPGSVVVERNVLEWRMDPTSEHRIPDVSDHEQPIIVVCSGGYASSLAAASLCDLGFEHVSDLVGGYQAWRSWLSEGVSQPLR